MLLALYLVNYGRFNFYNIIGTNIFKKTDLLMKLFLQYNIDAK